MKSIQTRHELEGPTGMLPPAVPKTSWIRKRRIVQSIPGTNERYNNSSQTNCTYKQKNSGGKYPSFSLNSVPVAKKRTRSSAQAGNQYVSASVLPISSGEENVQWKISSKQVQPYYGVCQQQVSGHHGFPPKSTFRGNNIIGVLDPPDQALVGREPGSNVNPPQGIPPTSPDELQGMDMTRFTAFRKPLRVPGASFWGKTVSKPNRHSSQFIAPPDYYTLSSMTMIQNAVQNYIWSKKSHEMLNPVTSLL